jgi:general secretion pathway protein G
MNSTAPATESGSRRDRIARGLLAMYPTSLVLTLVLAGFVPLLFRSACWSLFSHPRERAEADIARLCNAINEYTTLNAGRSPERLDILVCQDVNGRRLLSDPAVLIDPWHRPYGYEMPTSTPSYRVFSFGRDGKVGGSGDDADIDNFTSVAESDH